MKRKASRAGPPARPRPHAGDASHELRALVQELEIHQAELQSQNEALREAQGLLEESRDHYAVLFDFAPLAYATLGRAGVIETINLRGAELLGTERGRLLGAPFIRFVHRDFAPAFRNHIARCRRGGRVVTELMLAVRGRGPVPVELVSVAWRADDPNGRVLTSILDLSDRKQAEREREERLVEHALRVEAEHSNRVKDDFLTVLSHELRTPLSAIRGWAYLLRSDSADELERQHALDVIDRNSHVLTRMINDLLDVSRIERGKLELQMREVDLTAVIQGCLDSIRPGVVAKGVRLESQIDPSAARLHGDPLRLQQMISNVIANAVKFTPAGGRIDISVERRPPSPVGHPVAVGDGASGEPQHHARIRVRDTGIGIEPAELETVFERFHQIDSGTTRRFGGLGLGLSIVRHIAQLHDGRVWAVSGGRGRGTSVFIELPLPEDDVQDAAAQDAEAPTYHLKGVRVLVVDDDPDTLDVVTRVLQRLGAAVDPVESAPLAAQMLAKQRPDLLVSDLAMPGEDGYSLIRRVRTGESDGTERIPAIALTAVAGPPERERALAEGFERFVAKPVDPLELIRVVTELIHPRPTS